MNVLGTEEERQAQKATEAKGMFGAMGESSATQRR